MLGSLLDVIQTRLQLTGTRTQIHIGPLYYSIGFFFVYHQMHNDNLKSNSRETNVVSHNIYLLFALFSLNDLPKMKDFSKSLKYGE